MPNKIKPEYKPETEEQILGYLIEECGEVIHACGKTVRWGMDNFNPELPEDKQEQNWQWICRELKDLKRSIRLFEEFLKDNY